MSLSFENIVFKSASLGEENPMPDLKNNSYIHAKFSTTDNVTVQEKENFGKGAVSTLLPYLSQDGYDRRVKNRIFKAAILENDHLRAVFLPELGGRLWSLYHKKLKRNLLYTNDVVQPCNLALRNAWVAGGVEWNVGIKGHTPLTCSSLFAAESKNKNGEPILSMYEYERKRRVVYGVNAFLERDKLYIRSTVENLSERTPYMYWWSNIAVPEKGVRVLTDADEMFSCVYQDNHYVIDKIAAPYYNGKDLSYPEQASHAGDLFFKIPDNRKKWIAALNEDGIGLLQYSTSELKGRKVFFWGNGEGGRNWNTFLTGSDNKYIEIQAGLLNTQLEHILMPANTSWTWTECYTSIKIDPDVLSGDWKAASETVRHHIDAMPNPVSVDIPLDLPKKIHLFGSGWGALECGKISNYYEFPEASLSEEQKEWQFLKQSGYLPEPDDKTPPKSYQVTPEVLKALEKSLKSDIACHWYTYLQIGVVRYALDDISGALEAWKKSIEKKETPWVYRNLAMLCFNDLNDKKAATDCIKKAVELCKVPCRGLLGDAAKIFVECGASDEWIDIYNNLDKSLKSNGRLRFFAATAYVNCGQKEKARDIINSNFEMSDIKEGELSISAIWKTIYGDEKPLPMRLNFKMHEE